MADALILQRTGHNHCYNGWGSLKGSVQHLEKFSSKVWWIRRDILAAEVLFKGIPHDLIINWDQTGLSIVPSGYWTMEKEGAKTVPIAHNDDKRHLTAV